METYSEYLMHHGIKKMKWGKKNGPPYPLTDKQRSAAENAANPTSDSAKMLAKQGSDSRFNDTGAIKSLAEYRMQKAAAERKKAGWGIKTDEGNDIKDESQETIKEVDNRKYPTLSKKDNAYIKSKEGSERPQKVNQNETVNRNGKINLRDDQESYDQYQRMQRIKAGQQRESEKQRLRELREKDREEKEEKKRQQKYYDELARQAEKEADDYWREVRRQEAEAAETARIAKAKATVEESRRKGEEAAKKLQEHIQQEENKPGPKGKSISDDLKEVSSMTLEQIKKYYPDKYDQIKKEVEEAKNKKTDNSNIKKNYTGKNTSDLVASGHLSKGEPNKYGVIPQYAGRIVDGNKYELGIQGGNAYTFSIGLKYLQSNYPSVYETIQKGGQLTINLLKKYPDLYANILDALGYDDDRYKEAKKNSTKSSYEWKH